MVLRRRPRHQGSVWWRLLAVAAYPLCHRLNGALCLGLVTLCLANQPMPRINLNVPDILEGALWEGCRQQGIKRLKAHLIGPGWQTRR